MKILDATCGKKMMWYQKNHPMVTYMDKRNGKCKRGKVAPDVVSEWKDAPFPDESFDMIIFDPPHIIQEKATGNLIDDYGCLNPTTWRNDLLIGTKKLFDVLKNEGVFILKWDECVVSIDEILKLFPYRPLFGSRTGLNNKNIWVVFIKYRPEKPLLEG